MTDTMLAAALPRWDLTTFYPALESPEFEAAFARAGELTDRATAIFDRLGIGAASEPSTDPAAAFEEVVAALSEIHELLETLFNYLYAVFTVDTTVELPQTRLSELEQRLIPLSQLDPRLTAWLGDQDDAALLAASSVARDHAFMIRRERTRAAHLMTPAEESLVAELRVSSGSAWTKLHENVSSQISAVVEIDGERKTLTMPEIRLLAIDPRREVRKHAYEVEVEAWSANAVPLAAALNGIKGESLTLTARRRWESPLRLALFDNGLDQDVFDAMMAAAFEAFPELSRYLNAKARQYGCERLAWYDLYAPLSGATAEWSFERSEQMIRETFSAFSPRLGELARRAFDERWIDAPATPGKSDGAYCTVLGPGISRIFMNYVPSYPGLATLGHELGHAYHNVALENRPPLQRNSPSTLAETASIFCETLIRHAALTGASESDELVILEGALQDAIGSTIEVTSRFLFEQRFFEARKEHDVPVSAICELMRQSQIDTYGDGLDPELLHTYMWAAKGHYYSVDESYYNFPYMFGLLFGLGLYHQYMHEPAGFTARYDELLSSTGRADAAELGATFGLDLRKIEFWRSSFDVIRGDVARFIELAAKVEVP